MDKFLIINEDGSCAAVPTITFNKSDTEKIMVIAAKFEGDETFKIRQPGITAELIGTVSDQDKDFGLMVYSSLSKHSWDFTMYPDPELVLLTDNRNGHEVF